MGSLGVVIIATGHINYLRMAVTLAASIKHHEQTAICLAHDGIGATLTEKERALFDDEVICSSVHPLKMKLLMPGITPYDRTLYMDADMVMLPGNKVSDLFAGLDGVPFTIMNRYKEDACIWADVKDVRAAACNYTDPVFIPYSELMYFEKGEVATELFEAAVRIYDNPIPCVKFAGTVPDELPLVIASLKTGTKPHKLNWTPVFWHFRDKKDASLRPFELNKKYTAYSIGGNSCPQYVKEQYNNLSAYYCKGFGVKPYQAKDKRYYLKNRSKF